MCVLFDYLNKYYSLVNYIDFYRDIFPKGSFQEKGKFIEGKYNGIIVEVTKDKMSNGKLRVLRHTLTDDLDKLNEVCSRDNFCLMSPISYAGKTRDSSMARELYALTFDLDGIQTMIKDGVDYPYGLENLLHQINNVNLLPKPTYIVSSGTGLHLYYVLEKPLPMFKNIVEQLEILKKELTRMMWHDSISKLVYDIQYEPVCQGFRLVGTITKNGNRCSAFKVGEKVTIEYLNKFVSEEYKVKDFTYKSDLTLSQAKTKYPQWYKKRIENKEKIGTWKFNRAVYDKWLERIKKEAKLGHRYWCVWVLAVTAMKCGICYDELEKDAFNLIELMNKKSINKIDEFTSDDVLSALEGYDSAWFTYPIDKISYRTDIHIEKNKRNFRKQSVHLKIARAIQEINDKANETNWRSGNGRKNKKQIIIEWRNRNPKGKKIECYRQTGLSRVTIDKWWDF